MLKNRDKYIPIVEIPVTGNDIMRCLYKGRDLYGDKKIAIVGSESVVLGVEHLSEITGIKIKAFGLRKAEDYPQAVDIVKEQGYEVLIGGVKTCEYGNRIIPPLRERMEDITLLAQSFIKSYGLKLKKQNMSISAEALKMLENLNFPGNIRELKNICEKLCVLSESCEVGAEDALKEAKYSRSKAALALGVSRSTLYRWMKDFK